MKITRERIISYEEKVPTTLVGFADWEFSSGSIAGEDFKSFAKLFRKHIDKHLSGGAKILSFSSDHYCLSGFIGKDSKFVYFSISDVRHFPGNWLDNILIRTAESEQDYTGGSNNYVLLEDFGKKVEKLL